MEPQFSTINVYLPSLRSPCLKSNSVFSKIKPSFTKSTLRPDGENGISKKSMSSFNNCTVDSANNLTNYLKYVKVYLVSLNLSQSLYLINWRSSVRISINFGIVSSVSLQKKGYHQFLGLYLVLTTRKTSSSNVSQKTQIFTRIRNGAKDKWWRKSHLRFLLWLIIHRICNRKWQSSIKIQLFSRKHQISLGIRWVSWVCTSPWNNWVLGQEKIK